MDETLGHEETERAEARLWRRLEILARAEALARIGSWEWDMRTGEVELTDEMYRLVGLPRSERALTYRELLRRVHPDDRHRVLAAIRGALRGATYRIEHRIRQPDGTVRIVHADGEVLFDDAGKPVRMVGTAQDVTRRRKTIEQLEGGPRLFRVLVENARDVIFRYRVGPDEGFEYLSPSAGFYTGLTREELYATPALFFERVHPDDRHLVDEAIRDPEHHSPYQVRIRGRKGDWLWGEQVLVPIRDENGNLQAIEGISRDVTERKKAEEDRERLLGVIEEERRWLREVIHHLPVAVVLSTYHRGRWRLSCNDVALALLGRRRIGRMGTPREEGWLLHTDGTPVPLVRHPTARARRGETVAPEEYRMHRPDGIEVPVLASAAPISDHEGRISGVVSVWEDLTTVKELERLREEWTSLVAHDLRQPVTAIRAYGALLARQVERPETRAKANHIVDASKRLGRMIDDLLDVSKIEAHRLSLELQPVDLVRWIEAAIERAASDSGGARPLLRIEGEPPSPVLVDPVRLEQVLGNLLSNAVKYGTPGTPIEVTLRSTDETARISVANQGAPIPRDELPKLFGRFQRSRTVEGGRVAGLGLGLYISKGLVEAHGGRIEAEIDPAGRNVFTIEIPLRLPS